jgi:ribosomal protein L24
MVMVNDVVEVVLGKYKGCAGIVRRCTPQMVIVKLNNKDEDVRVYQSSVKVKTLEQEKYIENWEQMDMAEPCRSSITIRNGKIKLIKDELKQVQERMDYLVQLLESLEINK